MTVLGARLLYLHLPHTGGTSVAAALEAAGLGEHVGHRGVRPHLPLRELPSEWLAGRHVWTTIRDPWSWLLTFYHHNIDLENRPRGPLAEAVGPGPIPFALAVEKLCGSHPGPLTRILADMLGTADPIFVDLPRLAESMRLLYGRDIQVPRLNATGPLLGHLPRPAHGPILDHFTPDLIRLVASAESDVCERFGYLWPGAPATRGVLCC